MSVAVFEPQPVLALGGLCTFLERSEVPLGMSPNCSDIEFRPKTILSRPGLGLRFTDDSGFRGIKSFYGIDRVRRLVTLQDNGKLAVETPEGQLIQIQHMFQSGMLMKATDAFGRLFMAFSCVAGTSASGMPLIRPADFPSVYDPIPLSLEPFPVRPVNLAAPPNPLTATRDAAVGLITTGLHYVFYTFEDRFGNITQQSPVASWTSLGSDKVDFTNILMAGNGLDLTTVVRRLWMTPAYVTNAGVAGFFNLGALTLDNNSALQLVDVSLTDATLQTGTPWATNNLTLVPPPPAIGVTKFADRLVYWGVYEDVPPRLAQRIDGLGSDIVLLGNPSATFSSSVGWAGAGLGIINQITAYGSVGTRTGQVGVFFPAGTTTKDFPNLLTSSFADPQYWLKAGGRYGVLFRATALTPGDSVTVALIAQPSGVTLATATVALPSTTYPDLAWGVYAGDGVVNVPAGTTSIRYSVTVPGATQVWFDWIRPFLQQNKFNGSDIWIGDNLNPTDFDLVKSPLPAAPGDWQETRCCFEQTGNIYIVKEHSTWVTADNGQDPNTWSIDNVSFQMGTPSTHGVGIGPEFAIIAGREGVYRFDSGGINKISQEIETTWKGVDWTQGHLLWVTVDPTLKVIRVAVPLTTGPAGVCNIILKCDYTMGWESGWDEEGEQVSAKARKWTIDNVATICGELAEKDDGSSNVLMGGARATSSNAILADIATGISYQQLGTRALTLTGGQTQPMGPDVFNGGQYGEQWSFPFPSGTARYVMIGSVFPALGDYFVASFWARSGTAGVNVAATIKDPFRVTDVPIVITPAWQRFVAVFGPNPRGVDSHSITDGVLGIGSAVLTSATAPFAPVDAGKLIRIPNAGAGANPLYTLISVVTNPSTITLATANQSGFSLINQAATWGTQEAIDIDFGTLTNPISPIFFGFQLQSGQFDKGYSGHNLVGQPNIGTGLPSGCLSEPIVYTPGSDPPWKTQDWDALITSIYEIAPLAPTVFGRNIYDRLVARIRGYGNLVSYYVMPDGSLDPMNAGSTFPLLTTNPTNDVEIGGTQQGTFVGIRLQVQNARGWFALKRLALFTKRHESNAFRGKS